jgi:uncharacterized protein involved in tolerance to divalent cations
MTEMLVIMCTCPDEATASKLAGGLVEEHHPYDIPVRVTLFTLSTLCLWVLAFNAARVTLF